MTKSNDTTSKDTRFKKGNPGRKYGSRNKVSLAIDELLDGEAEVLTRKAIDMALEGDTVALRICMDRICPPRKSRTIEFELPPVKSATDVSEAHAAVINAMAQGEITPDEASTVAGILDAKRKSIETTELEARIAKLEKV